MFSCAKVHNHFFGLLDVQHQVMFTAPYCQFFYLLSVCRLIVVKDEGVHCSAVCKFQDVIRRKGASTVVCVGGVEQRAGHALLKADRAAAG